MFSFFKKKDENKKSAFDFLKNALSKTADSLVNNVISGVSNEIIDEFELDDIETNLIKADLGVDLAVELVEKIKNQKIKSSNLKNFLRQEFSNILNETPDNNLKYDKNKLNIYFVVGVNGAGKTTLIGKLAHKFKNEGNKVLLVAGDTYRAAAEEQLDIWAKRANVDIIREDKAQSAAIVYKGIEKAYQENFNVVIIDSAGRLQNKYNLIEELKKVKGVIDKKKQDAILETILVLDGTQGQNGLSQVTIFNEAVDVTSLAITKLDGTPKGGIIISIAKILKLPTKLIGIGEGMDDLQGFQKDEFINAIFD